MLVKNRQASSLDHHKLQYEDLEKDFKKDTSMTTATRKEFDATTFEKLSDLHLITSTCRVLYERHGRGLWMLLACSELVYIIWRNV